MSKSIYSPLTRKRRSIVGFTQLWLAPDHLLLVTNSRFNERYQRFLLADIQAIVVSDGLSVGALQLLAGALALLWTTLALVVESRFAKGFFFISGVFVLALVAIDFLRGPRCRCVLQTAVSRTPLAPLARARQAARFLSLLAPVIEGAQGSLAPERIASLAGGALTFSDNGVNSPVVPAPQGPPELPRERTNVAWMLFAILLLTGALVWAALLHASEALGLLSMAYSAEIALLLLVLIQGRAHPARLTYLLAIICAILFCIDVSTASGAAGWSALLQMARPGQAPRAVRYGWLSGSDALVFAVGWRFALGILGLAAWFSEAGGGRKLKSL